MFFNLENLLLGLLRKIVVNADYELSNTEMFLSS